MATNDDDLPPSDPVPGMSDTPFDSALSERYLVYALSTITARSLPDLRDGLKPVHRRLLWAMRAMRLDPSQGYKKSARVVGDVIGKFHPHGDTAVYDAMVRLAQDFSLRYPLVDGQGNFGNIDGDNAAAYRYTEARLTRVAVDLMQGLDEGTVDFKPTYNGEDEEPEIMPGLFPNLLANGASGIAVGMATNIPPHNAAEVIGAALLLIENQNAELGELLAHVKGPDFPTGGIVVDSPEAIALAYETGRGGFRVRARFSTGKVGDAWEETGVEKQAGGTWQLVISEIPYGVAKGKLIEQIAQLIADKKLPILEDVRDESAEDLRIVLVPKSRNVDPDILKESLYRLTDLESRFALNLNVLDATRTPKVMGLKQLLTEWLQHQIIVLVRRAQHRIAKIDDRLELVAGYIIAFLNLDRIIEIIRTEDEPKPVMIEEFVLTDRQAEAILNMRLRSLRKLEEMELKREQADLTAEREELAKLVESPARQKTRLRKDLEKLRTVYGLDTLLGARRTTIAEAAPARDIPLDAMIEKEPVTVILSKRGWIRAQRGHVAPEQWGEFKFKEGDELLFAVRAQTTDKLLIAASDGRFYTVGADKLPGGRGFGEPLRLMVDIDPEARIVALLPASAEGRLLLASTSGHGFIAQMAELIAETRKGRNVVNLKPKAQLTVARPIAAGDDSVAAIGENRKLVVFPLSEVPVMARGQGVALQRFRDGGLSDATTIVLAEGLSWKMGGESGRMRSNVDVTLWRVARGAAGRNPPEGFPRSNRFD
ncbi:MULTISPECIES: DNA topoisomerase IV subunit A [unclassified Sphingopyxis]|uniref:DNA topoisomerase IV subunit A n=1 Tax=unclassified Sphingopyxis TaxID=2614943 RepID=UPI0007368D23|nr:MULTISPECIES: DNA topoisomerase IV subunit A [unclassified Sphingopyxis]KTE44263.1 DNA topoisomerase IV subunit A [Sphingopyxis sp. HIX]KTE85912.1 DNA topoisomerase IV subunit A [Sphingopyxis sp. HXXIV]